MLSKKLKFALCLTLGCSVTPASSMLAAEVPAATASDAAVEAPPAETTAQQVAEKDFSDSELVTERFINGEVKVRRYIKQDSDYNYFNHGPWTRWNEDGKMLATGIYEDGLRHGPWTRWHVDGTPEHMKTDNYQGFAEPYISECNYTQGLLDGAWVITDSEDHMVCTIPFKGGKLDGTATWWRADGRKRLEMTFKEGILDGSMVELSKDEDPLSNVIYQNGRKLSPFVRKYPSGTTQIEGWYLLPKDETHIHFNWWNGSFAMEILSSQESGVRHGKWIYYHESGSKQYEGEFAQNKAIGEHNWWYANGQKQIEGQYDGQGRETGQWTWWHPTGLKRLEGTFENGQRIGEWVTWYDDGRVADVEKFAKNATQQQTRPSETQPTRRPSTARQYNRPRGRR